jgi:gamma-glutamyl-gamma-aminobutyrate hydrolase PuuD
MMGAYMKEIKLEQIFEHFPESEKNFLIQDFKELFSYHKQVTSYKESNSINTNEMNSGNIIYKSELSFEDLVKNITYISYLSKISFFTYQYLIDHGTNPYLIVEKVTYELNYNQSQGLEEQESVFLKLMETISSKGGSFNLSAYINPLSLPVNILNYFLNKNFTVLLHPSELYAVLRNSSNADEQQTIRTINLIDQFDNKVGNLSDTLRTYYSIDTNIRIADHLLSKGVDCSIIMRGALLKDSTVNIQELMDTVTKHTVLSESIIQDILSYGINLVDNNKVFHFVDYFIQNQLASPELILEIALERSLIDLMDIAMSKGANPEIIDFLKFIDSTALKTTHEMAEIIKRFPNIYYEQKFYELARSLGASNSHIAMFKDKYNLSKDYMLTTTNQQKLLTQEEIELLTPGMEVDINKYREITLNNDYGFSPLHLAILAGKFSLAKEMLIEGFNAFAFNINNITPIQLLTVVENNFGNGQEEYNTLLAAILDKVEDVDINLMHNETLADILLKNQNIANKVIEKTKDPLFKLFKDNALLDNFDPNKTYIGIAHGDGFWSTGIWSLARQVAEAKSDVVFHLLTKEITDAGGDDLLKKFDAFINPGAADSYPQLKQFTKDDCPFEMQLEKQYQFILDKSFELNIPYLGMCAGAQHLSLYHNGTLAPLEDYDHGQHQVTFLEGSLSYFLTLTKTQQELALSSCELPKVSFKGDTAHHYAALADKLGDNMDLGAISEDGVAMAYNHYNGIRYATQFHPEHHYEDLFPHEQAWLDNFINIAKMHHSHQADQAQHPIDYFKHVKETLDKCLRTSHCNNEDFIAEFNGNICNQPAHDSYI